MDVVGDGVDGQSKGPFSEETGLGVGAWLLPRRRSWRAPEVRCCGMRRQPRSRRAAWGLGSWRVWGVWEGVKQAVIGRLKENTTGTADFGGPNLQFDTEPHVRGWSCNRIDHGVGWSWVHNYLGWRAGVAGVLFGPLPQNMAVGFKISTLSLVKPARISAGR